MIEGRDVAEHNASSPVGSITLLFCDIVDFDQIVKQFEEDIVVILDEIFRRFDDLVQRWGCQKIETVGKQYVVAGGLKWTEMRIADKLKHIPYTHRVCELAKDMLKSMQNYRLPNNKEVQ